MSKTKIYENKLINKSNEFVNLNNVLLYNCKIEDDGTSFTYFSESLNYQLVNCSIKAKGVCFNSENSVIYNTTFENSSIESFWNSKHIILKKC